MPTPIAASGSSGQEWLREVRSHLGKIQVPVAHNGGEVIYTLFFSRLKPEYLGASAEVYGRDLAGILQLAQEQPGFVGVKSFTAADGERLTVVRFKDMETQLAWRRLPDHVSAQQRGRAEYYQEYRLVVCEELRAREWTRETDAGGAKPAET